MKLNRSQSTSRRDFLGTLALGAGAVSLASLASPLQAVAETEKLSQSPEDPDLWFSKIKGKHRIVFDVTQPNSILPFAWPRVFLMTNEQTGSSEKDCSEVVILRHEAIPFAMEHRLWEKYKFGDVFKISDPVTNASSVRNIFWQPKAGEYTVPGIGNVQIGINELQDNGVMFCVCNVALSVYSNVIGQKLNTDPVEVKNDFLAGLLPGIQVVPSGVWAVGRAQEHGCSYCFAG